MEKVTRAHLAGLELAITEMHKCGIKSGSLPHMVVTNLIDEAKAAPDQCAAGYMPIPTAEQLAEALENVGSFHDMSAELIAPELLANLLAETAKDCLVVGSSLPVGVPDALEQARRHLSNAIEDAEDGKAAAALPALREAAHFLAKAATPTVKAEQVPTPEPKGGTFCRVCGTKLCVTGVCTIYCPNRDCGVPGRGTKALTRRQLERLEAGIPAFDTADGAPSLPAAGSSGGEEVGSKIERLLDEAFRLLQHDTGEQDAEYRWQRQVLRENFQRVLNSCGSAQQSAPERVITSELQALVDTWTSCAAEAFECGKEVDIDLMLTELRALLASHAEGGKV